MPTSLKSCDLRSSDLQIAVSTLWQKKDLIGYRNLLAYVSSLGVRVFPKSSLDPSSWTYIASGNYSTTWKAPLLDKEDHVIAIKQPNTSFIRAKQNVEHHVQHEALSSMIQELRILADVKLREHPSLPHVLGVYLRTTRLIDIRNKTALCSQVANGICALHAYGLVHGDIKPENVLLFRRDGEISAAIADLGTCGLASQSIMIPGTRQFWAPENHNDSPFHAFMNRNPRDVYSFGLLVFSVLTYCKEDPFPEKSQFSIQHDDGRSWEILNSKLSCVESSGVEDLMRSCVKADPANRPAILEICHKLDAILGTVSRFEELQTLAETTLLTNPNSPRVSTLGQMPLPPQLLSKLLAEFTFVSYESTSIRIALTIAAFYAGIVGAGIEWPWNVIAKSQWILKAVELGSHAALSPLATDRNIINALEVLGPQILSIRKPIFQTPEVDWNKLIFRLQDLRDIGDEEVLKILPLIAPEEAKKKTQDSLAEHIDEAEDPEAAEHARVLRSSLRRLTIARDADLSIMDSDAFDLDYGMKADIVQSVYNNNLEDFITFAERDGLQSGSERLRYYTSVAIMNGSLEMVRYIVEQYGVSPNDFWEGAAINFTHFEDALMFGRRAIVQFFLEHDVSVPPAAGERLSALHLALRHDDELLIRMFCEYLKDHGNLEEVLESRTDGGEYPSCTPVSLAMDTGAWKAVKVLIEFGANVNAEPVGNRLLDSAVQPRSPACPTDVLQAILENGAEIDVIPEKGHPALQWAIWTGNILTVLYLLLHGADLYLSDEYDFIQEAMKLHKAREIGNPREIINEDGKAINDNWRCAQEASNVILQMIHVTSQREEGWEGRIQDLVNASAPECKGKMWVKVGDEPLMSAIEIQVFAVA